MEKDDPFQLTTGYTVHPEQFRDGDAMQKEEGLFIYGLVRAIKPTYCVETGTHKGVSSTYIALALRENSFKTNDLPFNTVRQGHLFTCDPTDWGASTNLRPLDQWVTYNQKRGIDFEPTQKIDFLFIDGFHEKEEVLAEWGHYYPHLAENAVVLFHDCHDMEEGTVNSADVNGAVKEIGIKTVLIPSLNRMRIYFHGKDSTV